MNATNPANDTQTPAYQALAAASRKMVDAMCNQLPDAQRKAAIEILALLGEAEMPSDEMLDTLRIDRTEGRRSAGGRWVTGTIARHAFEALVFPEHAENPNYEMNGSRISKFWLRNQLDQRVVCEFDRGWATMPSTPAAQRITDLLAAGLAETVFGK